MSSGAHNDTGFSFEVNDPETKSQIRFSLHYEEACDMFCFTFNTYDHRAVGDDFSPWKPYLSNSQTKFWISPDRARIMMNPHFWDSIKETMKKIDDKRKAENGFIDGSGI